MEQLINSVKQSLTSENWYAALTSVLTLPDICGKVDEPSVEGRGRYIRWCDTYLMSRYKEHLTGRDFYAIRCSFLHEGSAVTKEQKVKPDVHEFFFITKQEIHLITLINKNGRRVVLDVQMFCEDIITGVEDWIKNIKSDKVKSDKLDILLSIAELQTGVFVGSDGNFSFE